MRCGHRSPGKGLSRSVIKSRDDVETGSPDIDTGTKIREGSFGVGNGGCGDGNSLPDTSGRSVVNILVLVPGGNDNRDARAKKLKEEQEIRTNERFDLSHKTYLDYGTVDSVRGTTSKAQRGNGGGPSAFEFRGNEVEARDTVNRRRSRISTLCLAQLKA